MNEFERYKKEADEAVFEGWDFSFLKDRFIERPVVELPGNSKIKN
jgi:hypothetical protein